ncbi:hypothetical protein AX774_g4385 [Zancudomyces culisetae]|uniref:Uncharacterized protein n=1 Tax=Zancudomyces culisetae TaxID=1213189 RepID=A0A1R1PMH2_ZANCU|nr:hypothetical protein AX774_g4385 [Zancudomyces culisetae]|eukprot:OMH82146.1 hypothetical protein AX774_g4385 [Zancudomyces culisetae]
MADNMYRFPLLEIGLIGPTASSPKISNGFLASIGMRFVLLVTLPLYRWQRSQLSTIRFTTCNRFGPVYNLFTFSNVLFIPSCRSKCISLILSSAFTSVNTSRRPNLAEFL